MFFLLPFYDMALDYFCIHKNANPTFLLHPEGRLISFIVQEQPRPLVGIGWLWVQVFVDDHMVNVIAESMDREQ